MKWNANEARDLIAFHFLLIRISFCRHFYCHAYPHFESTPDRNSQLEMTEETGKQALLYIGVFFVTFFLGAC
jgi:hypothetical protein